jgi:hypothetical protein
MKALAGQLYFSRLIPRGLRDWHLDRCIRDAGLHQLAHADPPETFTDKVRFKILNDRRPLLTQWADKAAVREYVGARVGSQYLTELYLVTGDPRKIHREALPREFVLKPTHGWGGVVVGDHVPPEKRLPEPPVGWQLFEVSPARLDWDRLARICREWLQLRFRPRVEWAYRNVPPCILVEELLVDGDAVPPDYKFFVIHGRVHLIQVVTARFTNRRASPYSRDWAPMPVQFALPRGPEIEKPPRLTEMVRVAETLGEGTDFVRVDLYAIGDRIVVGELTSYHAGGIDPLRPPSFDLELGAQWTLPDYASEA